MKIYVLRHEKRLKSNDFEIDLTEDGKKDSVLLALLIKGLDIDEIYCSPYKRILQTIKPYIELTGNKVFIENSLYESLMGCKDKDNIRIR